ncbi:unnamed protein product [Soboliphyme baturini]|uniref:Histone-lysine N-methyltransferase eggless n=1 Tax=Soboliphyme baturini TaxID=241478 RepID=A0A183IW03_9BILA|nr:unnamed protein product [Soboliphyme baturini]
MNRELVNGNDVHDDCIRTTGSLKYSLWLNMKPTRTHQAQSCLVRHSVAPPSKPYKPHKCTNGCLPVEDEPLLYRGVNPLYIPILCGWNRFHMVVNTPDKRSTVFNICNNCCLYRTPCARTCRNIEEVVQYLRMTDSHLTPDLFSFEPLVWLTRTYQPLNPRVRIDDISEGVEGIKIECINEVDDDKPNDFEYRKDRFSCDPGLNLTVAQEFLSGCSCEDDCINPQECSCQLLTLQQNCFSRSARYRNRRLSNKPVVYGIYECNRLCKCSKRCGNRVVQQPLMMPLQIFKTERSGWGVRTLYDIPMGTFVCIYAGGLMSDNRAEALGHILGDEYYADLDFLGTVQSPCKSSHMSDTPQNFELQLYREVSPKIASDNCIDGSYQESSFENKRPRMSSTINSTDSLSLQSPETSFGPDTPLTDIISGKSGLYTVDAKFVGNVGRFFNHCCRPNLFVQNVFVDTHDLRLPWVTFFSSRLIVAGEELRWDYKYDLNVVPRKCIECVCGMPNCRNVLV